MNGNYSMRLIDFLLAVLIWQSGAAQTDTTKTRDPIQVIARPSQDSIVLRWAPLEMRFWLTGNKQGYIIERYTLVRDGKTLSEPEKKIITSAPVKPFEESRWERVVVNNKYAAIAAQALLGETFELNMKQSDAFAIVNKVKENDQRFSMALFCADLSVEVAKALGLHYVDKTVKKGEKYLYRVVFADFNTKPVMGSVFIGTDDTYDLPLTRDFSFQAEDKLVSFRWSQAYGRGIYTAYMLEKSDDGKQFHTVFDDPITTASPDAQETKYHYVNDTLQSLNKEYYYRVKGISPFGEYGPPSEVLKVISIKKLSTAPHINDAISTDNRTIELSWQFPDNLNEAIEGFNIERATVPSGRYSKVNKELIAKEFRKYIDNTPEQTNYYRIVALTRDQRQVRSLDYFIHLIDSIPPSPPIGIKGSVDEHGAVTLTWSPNQENDIYGYRIYRAYYANEEFAQLTSGPVKETTFSDKVVLKSLNDKVHYQVMAIDIHQNHSTLSDIYSLSLPDHVPPVAPVFLPVQSSIEGVALSWIRSSSTDVTRYDLYRKGDNSQWIRITSLPANQDTLYIYKDISLKNGEMRNYTVVAIDDAGLESPPSAPVNGSRIRRSVWPAVTLADPFIDKGIGKVILNWTYDQIEIKVYQVYKSINDSPWQLYRTIANNEFTDPLTAGNAYRYTVIAVFKDGSKSEMPKGVSFRY
jgi:fibronectin type 3 domain-containing protein